MRIAFLVDHLGSGGAQRQAVELAVAFQRQPDVKVCVIVYRERDFFKQRLERADVSLFQIRKSHTLDPLFPIRLARWFRANPVDVVHAFMLPSVLWALSASRMLKKRERPLIIAGERNSRIATSLLEWCLQAVAYRVATAVTTNCSPAAVAINERLGVPSARIHRLPNGIDLAAWDRAGAGSPPFEVEPGRFNLCLVGRLEPQKNHALLIEALRRIGPKQLRDWRVWLIGSPVDGDAPADDLREQIRHAGLHETVRMVPAQQRIAPLVRRMSALVLSSTVEGFPNVVLEAMASRVPVVATRVGEVPFLIDDEICGFTVPSGDAAALAAALVRMASLSPRARRTMGEAARMCVEKHYAMDVVARDYIRTYRELLSQHSRPSMR